MMKIFWVWQKDVKILDKDIDDSVFESEEEEWQIALDIIETPKKIKIYAPIAWIELEEIDLTLSKWVLTIKWEREKPSAYYDEENTVRNLECYWGKFTRNIILPENLDFDLVKAVMENNLLKISIPKLHVSAQNIKINRIGDNF